jgi:putative peptide zinc metalloprotease protein
MVELDSLQRLQDNLIVDTSEGKPVYLIAIGSKPIYLRLSATSYYLLQQRSKGSSFEIIAQNFSKSKHVTSPEEIESAYLKVIHQIKEIEQKSKSRPSSYFFQLPLISQLIVKKLATIGSVAFYRPGIFISLVLIVLSITILPPPEVINFAIDPTCFLFSYLLLFFSLLMHELGHASACVRYGAAPSEIGFTIYLIWPAFYTDVNNAWLLKRWQRVVVDSGGIFFQIITGAIYILIYKLTNWSPIPLSLVMIFSTCLLNLNPFFKFDGYWIFADAFGITNLEQARVRIVQYFFGILRRRNVEPLPWPPLLIIILMVYSILSFVVWGYLLGNMSFLFINTILYYPSILANIFADIIAQNPIIGTQKFKYFLESTFTLLFGCLIFGRLVKAIYSYGHKYLINKLALKN